MEVAQKHDLGELRGASAAQLELIFATCTEMMLGLNRLPQPVIASVQGVATAAGCQLVASCDLAVASEAARFATPGVHIGLCDGSRSSGAAMRDRQSGPR